MPEEEIEKKEEQAEEQAEEKPVIENSEKTEEVSESETPKEEEVEKKPGELSDRNMEKVQERIDELVGLVAQQKRVIEELGQKTNNEKKTTVPTKSQLLSILQDDEQKEYHAWAIDQLTELKVNEQIRELQKTVTVATSKRESYEKACREFPESSNPKSALWALAEKIYAEQKLEAHPDGQYIAAALANAQLTSSKSKDVSAVQKKLDKERAKTSLMAGGKKVVVSADSSYEKLKKEGMAAGYMSGPWQKWQAEMLKRKKQ
jgi:pyruvate-formate lyase